MVLISNLCDAFRISIPTTLFSAVVSRLIPSESSLTHQASCPQIGYTGHLLRHHSIPSLNFAFLKSHSPRVAVGICEKKRLLMLLHHMVRSASSYKPVTHWCVMCPFRSVASGDDVYLFGEER